MKLRGGGRIKPKYLTTLELDLGDLGYHECLIYGTVEFHPYEPHLGGPSFTASVSHIEAPLGASTVLKVEGSKLGEMDLQWLNGMVEDDAVRVWEEDKGETVLY